MVLLKEFFERIIFRKISSQQSIQNYPAYKKLIGQSRLLFYSPAVHIQKQLIFADILGFLNTHWVQTSVYQQTSFKVSKGAKITNRYNQVPHLTQDTNGKVTNSQLDTTNKSQEVSPFAAGDHKAQINRRAQRHNKNKTEKHKRSTKEAPILTYPWVKGKN